MEQFDIVVVGGGLVGASLAACLRHLPLKIAIIEANPQAVPAENDNRVIALNYVSRRIFEGMNVWHNIEPQAEAIKHIHVSNRGHFGIARLPHHLLNLPALGYVVRAKHIGKGLHASLEATTVIAPAQVTQITTQDDSVHIEYQQQDQTQTLSARLLIAADGANSQICQQLNIPIHSQAYDQTAIVTNITVDQSHQNTAYERFTDTGPIALLPVADKQFSLVWTVQHEEVDAIQQLDESAFLNMIQQQFGWRAGRFVATEPRFAFPLSLSYSEHLTTQRTVIMGNAAHTLHPVAGQGFNLGLRDVASLAEVISKAWEHGQHDVGADGLLHTYASYQSDDQKTVTWLTDGLVQVFSNNFTPLAAARNLGLLALDALPPVKKYLMRQMTGLNSYPSNLARGRKML
ncbi:2-octaprenyl-6-methoxyphenyl hydroxylase [Candidatus Albibeggiatoa sp. nov. NOAA]|uniref:2-octaprenyl-6-methoxyphenyl hydroxylase n=1 Tax=Candidatus Albibeggiatoa sp. nov. NOAA TaxID=3162724 RepID=UPI0032F31E60|nr:2-octaprenyl-6-methoxyphenyl hydroxylase [Thiotrichaceae bacterium]